VDKRGNSYAISYGDMAVLIRTNADIRRFLPYLVEAGIPHVVDSGEIVFEQEIVTLTLACLDWIFRRNDQQNQSVTEVTAPYFQYLNQQGHAGVSKARVRTELTNLRSALDKIAAKGRKDYLPNLGLQGIFHQLLEAMGLAEVDLSESNHYYLATLSQAISDYEAVWQRLRHTEYKYFRGFIRAWGQFSYAVPSRSDIQPIKAVKVMTIHKAKGLEFPVLFMPYLNKKRKGRGADVFVDESLYDSDRYAGGEEEERRVYYVALTRAEKYLFLSGMRHDSEVKHERQPADFIHELRRGLLAPPQKLVLKKSGLPERKSDTYDFSTTFSELSAYGRCGYDYKLRHVFGYNAGVPVAFGYGTQIHNILNIIHRNYRDRPLSNEEIEKLIKKHFYLRYAPQAGTNGLFREPFRLQSHRGYGR
jgi:DNA helicase-2/ATP-dependent DNA helicase PcrA